VGYTDRRVARQAGGEADIRVILKASFSFFKIRKVG
jgi:hypothetical protein